MTLLTAAALAVPPSSTLTGAEGTLSWSVQATDDTVTIHGKSPSWTVEHTASASLAPRHTVHHDASNGDVVISYTPDSAEITRKGKTWTVQQQGLWDGDTLDVRLGSEVARGRTNQAFSVVDPGSGKVYSLDSAKVADEMCGSVACSHVRVQLTGWMRLAGPTWHYWYGSDGQLLQFKGPAGHFAVGGVK